MKRRDFVVNTGMLAAAGASTACARADRGTTQPDSATANQQTTDQATTNPAPRPTPATAEAPEDLSTWQGVRAEFALDPEKIHMAMFFLASHPRPVARAIERIRGEFDADPYGGFVHNVRDGAPAARKAAAAYLGVDPAEIALTDSTTMGLGLMYSGLVLGKGDEILAASRQHYATEETLRIAMQQHVRHGATLRTFDLHGPSRQASVEEMTNNLRRAIGPKTRVVALTWVDSITGVRIPSRELADVIAEANAKRGPDEQIIYCLDGVHGFGVEGSTIAELGCDFMSAGCHKWMFGPRGTGILYGRRQHWPRVRSSLAAFGPAPFSMWTGAKPRGPIDFADRMTPGGFHSFEMRWALPEAFAFHQRLGRTRVRDRIHELNTRLKLGLERLPHIDLLTPTAASLSAGIVAFDVPGAQPGDVKKFLHERKINASTSPSKVPHVRLAPSILNSEDEVDACIAALGEWPSKISLATPPVSPS